MLVGSWCLIICRVPSTTTGTKISSSMLLRRATFAITPMKYDEDLLPFAMGPDLAHPELAFNQETDAKLLAWVETVPSGWPEAAHDLASTLTDNPGRISRAFRGLLSGYSVRPEEVLKITMETPHDGHHGLVSSDKVPFLSFCAHHFLPFFGLVDIVYEPGEYIIGIGKIPRLVTAPPSPSHCQSPCANTLPTTWWSTPRPRAPISPPPPTPPPPPLPTHS